jgi:aldehyde dehydrogenase (NAD+)
MTADFIEGLVNDQRTYFNSGLTRDVSFRLEQLRKLKQAILTQEQDIIKALHRDLNKSDQEAYTTEILPILIELNHAIKQLKAWAKTRRVRTPITHFGASSRIYPEPYGVTLIIAPWNYPFSLVLWPLIGAMAAGNCAVLKPSEYAPNVSKALAKLIESTFSKDFITVVEGGVEVNKELLKQRLDYIFFTGGSEIGKIVMEAAAKHLTPVTLELGGKSPCIVHEDANVQLAAKRIVWGKLLNAGQTCVAPDYLVVHRNVKAKLIDYMKQYITEMHDWSKQKSESSARMINTKHFHRVCSYLQDGRILKGGSYDEASLYIEPTLIDQVSWTDSLMQDEIFGPILPIIEYENLSEILKKMGEKPKPLALYLFSESKNIQNQVIEKISFGGGCVNDTLMHLTSPYLPFGGVGNSGMGSYHGKASFDLFSHHKSILKQTTRFDLALRYNNSTKLLTFIKKFFK